MAPSSSTPPAVPASPHRGIRLAGGVALGLLALALRLRGLGRHPLWLDEAYSVWLARLPTREMVEAVAGHTGPPLYYLLLHAWLWLFGEGEIAVRALSVLFGLALVPASASLARRLGGEPAAWATASLVATTPMLVQFSQEARMYTLLPLCAVLAAERLLAYLQGGKRRALAAHAIFLAAACWTHNWGVLLLPAAGLAVLACRPDRGRAWLVGAAGSILLYAPWLPVLAAQTRDASYRFVQMVQDLPAWRLPLESVVLFASGVGTTGGRATSLLPWPGGALAALLWAASMVPALRGRSGAEGRGLLVLAAAPLLLAAGLTAASKPIYLLGRYEILALPILLALVGSGCVAWLRGRARVLAVGAWAGALALGSLAYTGSYSRSFPEPILAAALGPQLRPGDRVVFTGLLRVATEYHLRRAGAPFDAYSFPAAAAGHPAWFYEGDYDASDPALAAEAREHCPPPGGRTWVLATPTDTSNLLLRELAACSELRRPFADAAPPVSNIGLALPGGLSLRTEPARSHRSGSH